MSYAVRKSSMRDSACPTLKRSRGLRFQNLRPDEDVRNGRGCKSSFIMSI